MALESDDGEWLSARRSRPASAADSHPPPSVPAPAADSHPPPHVPAPPAVSEWLPYDQPPPHVPAPSPQAPSSTSAEEEDTEYS